MDGETRGDIKDALDAVPVGPSEQRIADGLRKLLLDRCHFENPDDVDPPGLRATLFGQKASPAVREDPHHQDFQNGNDRGATCAARRRCAAPMDPPAPHLKHL